MSENMNLFKCPECGADLREVGIQEVLVDCFAVTEIKFDKETKKIDMGKTEIDDFIEQRVVCLGCSSELYDRTAIEIMDAFREDEQEGSSYERREQQ